MRGSKGRGGSGRNLEAEILSVNQREERVEVGGLRGFMESRMKTEEG